MKKLLNCFVILIFILFACTGINTDANNVEIEINCSQLLSGNWGDELEYKVEVQNNNTSAVKGTVEIKVKCHDGSSYKKEVDFSEIKGLETSTKKGSMDIDNKLYKEAKINDKDFTFK